MSTNPPCDPTTEPATNPPEISAVLFDYGMVLTGAPDPVAKAHMERIFEAEPDTFHTAYWAHREAYDRGELNGDAYWHAVAIDLHKTLDDTQLQQLIAADTALWTQPNQAMIDWAAKLRTSGLKTGILSNLGDEMEHGVRARFHWLRDFTHQTFSHRLGMAKPDAGIYHHAAAGLETPHAKILFIDDKPENIAAAKAAGMEAIQYTTHEEFVDCMTARGYASLL